MNRPPHFDPLGRERAYQKYNELTEGALRLTFPHRLASTQFCDSCLPGDLKDYGRGNPS